MRIGIITFDGMDELDAIGPFEVLSNAEQLEVVLMAEGAPKMVRGSHGLVIQVHAPIDRGCQWWLVPGGGWADRSPAGTYAEIERGSLPREIAAAHAAGVKIASVCTGAMLVSAAGLLRGRPCTTHHVARAALAAEGGTLMDARVVDDGDIVSAAGVTSGLDLSLHLIERWLGADAAARCANEMEHQRSASIWVRPSDRHRRCDPLLP